MRTFSRWMPALPDRRTTLSARVLAGIVILSIAALVYSSWLARIVVALVIVIGTIIHERDMQRLSRLAGTRPGEDIGSFARAFDRRREPFDPRVVRAVWDALQPHVRTRGGYAPLRPTDRIDDLRIDWEDLEDVMAEAAARAGCSLDNVTTYPRFSQITTVGDVVVLLSSQPALSAA